MQRRKRQLKAKEAGKVEAQHVSAGAAVLGLIAGVGEAAAMTKVSSPTVGRQRWCVPRCWASSRQGGRNDMTVSHGSSRAWHTLSKVLPLPPAARPPSPPLRMR